MTFALSPQFTITNRQNPAITRIEEASSAWNRFELGHCATWFAPFQAGREAT
jgi:hypothetical protein